MVIVMASTGYDEFEDPLNFELSPYEDVPPPPPPPPANDYYNQPRRQQPQRQPAQRQRQQQPRRQPQQRSQGQRRGRRSKPPSRIVGPLISVVVLILLVALLVTPYGQSLLQDLADPASYSYREYPKEAEYIVDRTITLNGVAEYTLYSPQPYNQGNVQVPVQDIVSIQPEIISGSATYTLEEKWGGGIEWMTWRASAASGAQVIKIRYHVKTHSVLWDIDRETSGNVDQIDDTYKNRYLGDGWKIIPNNRTIRELAAQLTKDEPTVYGKLKAIYDYMDSNFEYETGVTSEPKNPYDTLIDRRGDCDDQSLLLISLARAVGIPAWLELGILYISTSESWGLHGWAKVMIPTRDGQNGWANIDIVNDQFLFRDPNRITEWEDDGIFENGEWHLYNYYYALADYRPGDGPLVWRDDFETKDMITSGTPIRINTKTGRPIEEKLPGFEAPALLVPLAVMAILGRKHKKKNKMIEML